MVQYSFTSTETRRLVRMDSPGRPPRLSCSSWTMTPSEDVALVELIYLVFTHVPGGNDRRQLRSLSLHLCDVFLSTN